MGFLDGSSYDGEFSNGLFQGRGKHRSATGETYEGEFKDNKHCGQGFILFPNQDTYEGEWSDNMMCGKGTMRWHSSRGLRYSGDWINDEMHGNGSMWLADGKVFNGAFESGSPTEGTLELPAGEKFHAIYDGTTPFSDGATPHTLLPV